MFRIYKTNINDIDEVSSLIERLNSNSENNIGYCAKKKEEIEKALREDFYGEEAEGQIFAAIKDGKIIGVLGCDCDIDEKSGEVWGPFIDIDSYETWLEIASSLWKKLRENTKELEAYGMFINADNIRGIEFAKTNGAMFKSEEEILVLKRGDFKGNSYEDIKELNNEEREDFINFHNEIFRDTYLSGAGIISRINPSRKVYVNEEDGKILGYIYIEVEEEFGEATVEFLAVDKECRNKGIGYKLLNKGLEWIFSFENIEHIDLCVRSSNLAAVNLYKKNGFNTEATLQWFKLMV